MQPVDNRVLARLRGMGRGCVFTSKDFLDLGNYEAVKKNLLRLEKAGKIRRLLRGVYDYPEHSRLLKGPASPDPDIIAHAIARAHGWTIVPSGETALNLLGLSTQVPAQWQYFSDGPTKKYGWKGGVIVLRHRTNKETTSLSPKTALVVQALKVLGKDHVGDNILKTLRLSLDVRERFRALREARYATAWVYGIIKRLAAKEEKGDA